MADRDHRRGLDRVDAPDPTRARRGDVHGKRALYSVDPEANPTPLVVVRCERCDVERGLTSREARRLLRPPWFGDPVRRRMWTRCPSCRRRSWLRVRAGAGVPWPLRHLRG